MVCRKTTRPIYDVLPMPFSAKLPRLQTLKGYVNKFPIRVVEAAGVEPASLLNLPAATTCLVRRES